MLEPAQIATHGMVDANVRDDHGVRLRILQFLNHCREAGIDVLNVGQLHADPAAKPSTSEIEYIIDQRGHAPNVGFDACGNSR